jgi:hypothetical protein
VITEPRRRQQNDNTLRFARERHNVMAKESVSFFKAEVLPVHVMKAATDGGEQRPVPVPSRGGVGPHCVTYVFVSLGSIIICR